MPTESGPSSQSGTPNSHTPSGSLKTESKKGKSRDIASRACKFCRRPVDQGLRTLTLRFEACAGDRCRLRKTRCINDGGDCAYCISIGKPCQYEPASRGPPLTYTESLERRISSLEGMLQAISLEAGVDLVQMLSEADDTDQSRTTAMLRAAEVIRSKAPIAQATTDDAHPETEVMPKEKELKTDEVSGVHLRVPQDLQPDLGSKSRFRYFGRTSGVALAQDHIPPSRHVRTTPMSELSLVEDMLMGEEELQAMPVRFPPPDLVSGCGCLGSSDHH